MDHPTALASWRHRGCSVDLCADAGRVAPFRITHPSGLSLGEVANLREARDLIDEELPLLRQRLAASA
ncbi:MULTISPECIES: hypothetical protein [Aphanothece]|uniref:hypothetical protein n=1 Tax=Aphanothece TaxID=1121 RepID=UPI0039855174